MRSRSKLILLLAALVMLFSANARAAAEPKTKTESVTFKSGEDTVGGFLAEPDTPGKHPAIIVIHEWWGLNDWVKEQAEKLAAHGYVAFAVDLYRGQVATDPETAHEISRGAPQDRVIRDLSAADTFLRADKHV